MNTTKTTKKTAVPGILLLVLMLTLTACSSDDNPVAPQVEADPPAPVLYEVQIDLDEFEINGDCDADPIIGGANPGEFDYTIEIWARNYDNKYAMIRELTGSFTRRGGQTYGIGQRIGFRVEAGKNYYVGFKATEKDGVGNPDDYVGYDQDVNKAGGQLFYDHELTIGDGGCGMSLTYTAEEIVIF